MNVNGKYLKDEKGSVISPITSFDTVFNTDGTKLSDFIQNDGTSYFKIGKIHVEFGSKQVTCAARTATQFTVTFNKPFDTNNYVAFFGKAYVSGSTELYPTLYTGNKTTTSCIVDIYNNATYNITEWFYYLIMNCEA